MYIPRHFRQEDRGVLLDFIHNNGFGLLLTWNDGEVMASHIPLLVDTQDEDIILRGHVARANPHWKLFSVSDSPSESSGKSGTDSIGESTAIFQGAHAYISPSWYKSPGVPTWNYTAVHVRGNPVLVDDENALHDIVLDLSDKYESMRADPWIPNYDESMLAAIVGFKMVVSTVEGKFKLGQNRSEADRNGVIDTLQQGTSDNERLIAGLMANL